MPSTFQRHLAILFLSMVVLFSLNSQTLKPSRSWLTVDTIMRDPKWMGTSPDNVYWSEDGERIFFEWRREGDEGDSLYVINASGGQARRVMLEERKKLPSRFGNYTKDWSKKTYIREGDVFALDIRRNVETQLMQSVTGESNPRFSFDERKVTFEREGNMFSRNLSTGVETQLTNLRSGSQPPESRKTDLQKTLERQQMELFEVLKNRKDDRDAQKKFQEMLELKKPKPFYVGQKNASGFFLSPDEKYVTLVLAETQTSAKRTIVPNYVTESGFTEDIGARTKVGEPTTVFEFFVYNIGLDSMMAVKPDSIPGLILPKSPTDTSKANPKPRPVSYNGPFWSHDGKSAFVQVFSQDNKDRWIVALDVEKAKFGTVIEHQNDDAWIGGPGIRFGSVGWMPDNKRMYFQSEADGWSHLYTATIDGKSKTQLTKGKFEIYQPMMSRDKKRWYFTSNEVHLGEQHFYSMPLEGGASTRITSLEGRNQAILSPDEDRIALLYSYSNKMPELYVMENRPSAKVTRLTDSPSREFSAYAWRVPDLLTFKARDGADIPARVYKPEKPNGAAVIFVHGAGYLQNAHKWWSSYFREYMFHNLLADKGYTVLDMDYRASAGLGRDWRTPIYRYMGGKDLDDQVDGAKWLVQQHGIDARRIGIYGGSYGGFITLMALFTQPDVFAAGAALRPVTDWAHYNHGYTSNILNIPQEDTIAYRRSSPIYHAERLKKPLLICHGMVDVNVHFQDAVRLVQRLIELKKENWELAVYPVEDHGFREPSSWTDEYKRILKLFESNLRK
ncbi:MAG: prolyl oligopeptidase family serine peptidase [Ignavibacteriales bacterium]|nr:prolyl oligopeptidase family serine peptidase [Ignavibacteriales bacterium]